MLAEHVVGGGSGLALSGSCERQEGLLARQRMEDFDDVTDGVDVGI